ncbi:MAG: HXXEE domain-containing protein [Pseudomonadota bacterium]
MSADGPWSWLDIAFPWIGLAGAALLAGLMFASNQLRGNMNVSRWRDPVWLAWFGMFAYLIHNVEEYGVDLSGQPHAFPDALCTNLGLGPFPACPLPHAFFLAVNLPMFWIVAPLAGLLARRHPLIGLTTYSVIFINALVHIAPMIARQSYNPGALSALLIFLPASFWVARTCFGKNKLSHKALALLVTNGVLVHIVLMGSVMLYIHGELGAAALIFIQLMNAALLLLIPWIGEKRLSAPAPYFNPLG